MKRSNLLLLILFLALGGAAAWYLTKGKTTSTLTGDAVFWLDDPDEVAKIFIAERTGRTNTLEKKDGRWMLNGKFPARPSAVSNLLDVVKRVRVAYPTPKTAVEGMVKDLAAHGIKIELYDSSNRLLKAFYVGGSTQDEDGTYFIMEGSSNPYVCHLPGWKGGLRARVAMGETDWRDRTVFGLKPQQIQAVWIEYPGLKNQSFKLEKTSGQYAVKPFYEISPEVKKSLRNGAVESFLAGFESLGAESFENENPFRDSISALPPFAIVTVTDVKGTKKEVHFHPLFPVDSPAAGLGTLGTNQPSNSGVEAYIANTGDGDFLLIQHLVFGKIFWGYGQFFQQ